MQSVESAVALRAIARECRDKGDITAATDAFARSLTMSLSEPTLIKAQRALEQGALAEAGELLGQLLRVEPENVLALRLLGDLENRRKRPGFADNAYRQSLALVPHQVEALHGLALSLYRQGRLREARQAADQLLHYAPADIPGRLIKAAIHAAIGDSEMTSALYRGLVTERPLHVPSWLGLGHSERTVGRTEVAVAAYREALTADPSSGEAWWYLANLKTFQFSDDDVAAMTDLTGRKGPGDYQRGMAHFALGKALADRGEDRTAFRHWATARDLTRPDARYDAEGASARLKEWVTASLTECDHRPGSTDDLQGSPIFIVGLPRAGSTLLEQILGSHSQIEATSELAYIDIVARRFTSDPRALKTADYRALRDEYLAAAMIHRHTAKPIFIDKMPGNFAHSALILAMFPNAKIVDVRRHPLASRLSIYRHHFVGGYDFANQLGHIARHYADYAVAMRQFDQGRPGAIHHVEYEKLVDNTEFEVRRLLEYIGVPFEPACLRWFENGQHVRTPSSEQVRRPLYREGLDEWQRWRIELESNL